ncbi:glucose 1-dehydrogenase [Salinisphaera hydrothermalis]|uniref:Putative glucose 1-dehydrogenase n=1 Tax=Salinisphaera hydrothermalis (strain C41B8) TaxID=1304275 RepID=A0A084IHG7_SALHC|nr:glucose 1-dehydrogenase [Salinisphaera hydrothermalis]KEZ76151.1 putative glucose 1-dehydrogenase [Salinisphaera hydrothermalis C41B8]
MSKLADKVALVTGASKGIGAAIARQLAADGASVVVNYASSQAGAEAVVAEISQAGGQAVAVGGDVSRADDARRLTEAAIEHFGRLDILVNNSGVYEFSALDDISEAHYRRQFDINVLGLLWVTQAAAKHMSDGGSIVNVSSLATRIVPPNSAVYSGTKGAVEAITGVLAQELGPRRIRVNAVSPGMVETEGTQTAGIIGSDMAADTVKRTPLGRIGEPQDIASIVAFLASDDSYWLTGENLYAAGGMR